MAVRRPGTRARYAEHYAETLPVPCDECHPLYRAGYKAFVAAVRKENFGEAYDLGIELSKMCMSDDMCNSSED